LRVVLGTHELSSIGGSETYLVTLAQQLGRLGHDVTLHAAECGEMAEVARSAGVLVAQAEHDLPAEVDAVVSQHASSTLVLAARYPGVPLAFVIHGVTWDCSLPPQVDGVVSRVVALNDRTARVAASAHAGQVTRLRQPIDLERFFPRGPLRERPKHVLLLGNYLRGSRRDHLVDACESLGMECLQIGRHGTLATATPEQAMGDADIVVGYGRSVLEGMASGRAAFVYDHSGGDGWVTAQSYPALEANGFAGTASDTVLDPAGLPDRLAAYRPEMGEVNRELARKHHEAVRHGVEMSELLSEMTPEGRPSSSHQLELARVLRSQWQADGRAASLGVEVAELRERLIKAERELEAQQDALERFRATRRYRVAGALGRPMDLARRLTKRSGR